MTAETLLANFDLIADAPNGIARLRELILQLAVQGQLVPQDPKEASPCKTFQGIRCIARTEQTSVGWILCKYRDLTSLVTSGSRGWKEHYASSGALFVRAQNIKTDALDLSDPAYVSLPARVEGKRAQVQLFDILVTITGANVTKTALVSEPIPEAYVSQHIALTRPTWPEMAPWLHLCFLSPASARGELEALAYGAKPGLNLSNIRDLTIPIPPLGEGQMKSE